MVQKKANIYFSHPVVISPQYVKVKLYLLCLAFIKPCFKKRKFQYKKQFSKLGACSEIKNRAGSIFSILEHKIFISGACSRNKNQFFLNRSRFLISGAHIFHFGSMLPKIKFSFQFRKKISISGAGFTNSGA